MEHPNNTSKRIVLIGGTGFIGQKLAEKLGDENNVVVVARTLPKNVQEGITFTQAHFGNRDEMDSVLSKGDIVVHLACSTIPATSEANRAKDIEENVVATVNLLESCVKNGVEKFVYVSSGGTVYGDHGKNILSEEALCAPVSAHGAMKLSIEQYVGMYHRQFGLPYIIVRPGNVYGRDFEPGREQGAIEVFLSCALRGEPINIWGDGNVTRDYVHVDDVAEFFVRILKDDVVNDTYNVGSAEGTSLNEIVKLIEEVTGTHVPAHAFAYTASRAFDVPYIVLDTSKAKRQLGWSPKRSLKDGLGGYYQQIRSRQ